LTIHWQASFQLSESDGNSKMDFPAERPWFAAHSRNSTQYRVSSPFGPIQGTLESPFLGVCQKSLSGWISSWGDPQVYRSRWEARGSRGLIEAPRSPRSDRSTPHHLLAVSSRGMELTGRGRGPDQAPPAIRSAYSLQSQTD